MGKVDTLDLHPLSFREFLDALGEKMLRETIDENRQSLLQPFSPKLASLLRQYYFVGGMPEAVLSFSETGTPADARFVQEQILIGYERDMSKHLDSRETEYALSAIESSLREL